MERYNANLPKASAVQAEANSFAFLNAQLNIDSGSERVMDVADPTQQLAYAKSAKPSIMENLRSGIGKKRNKMDLIDFDL